MANTPGGMVRPSVFEVQVGRRFRRTWRFRFLHLAFWLLLSFARDALVHL
jgi:hypothetical protein